MKFVILCLFLCFSTVVGAQNLYSVKYDESNGLASSKVYSIHADSKGYLWFATEEGVSRYNGLQFENFTSTEGLTDNDILSIFEDSQGRIWFAAFNGKPCFMESDRIYSPESIGILKSYSSGSHIESYFEDSNGLIWICSQSTIGSINFIDSTVVNYKVKKGIQVFEHESEIYAFTGRDYLHNLSLGEKVLLPNLPFDEAEKNGGESMLKINSKQWLVSKANNLYITDSGISKASLIVSLGDEVGFIYSLRKNVDNEFLVCTDAGVYQFDQDFKLTRRLLSGVRVTDGVFDHEDGMWFATANGVYHFPALNCKQLNVTESYAAKLISHNNLLAFVSDYSKAYLFQIDSFDSIIELGVADYQFPIQDLCINNDTLYIAGDNGIGFLDKQNRYSQIAGEYSVKSLLFYDDYWYIGTDRYFFRTRELEAISGRLPDIFSNHEIELLLEDRCYSISKVDGSLFFGSRSGLYEFNEDHLKIIDTVSLKDARVTDVQKFENQLFIGSYNSGLMRYKNEKITQVKGSENLKINSVKKNHAGELIVSGQRGIYKFTSNNELKMLSSNSNLKINGVEFLDPNISFIANSKGVLIKSNQQFDDVKYDPKIEVKMYNKNGEYTGNHYSLAYDDNSVSFFIEPITYSGLVVNYRYQLQGSDDTWVISNSTKKELISYKKLSAGPYVFKVEWKDSQGNWVKKSKQLKFEIRRPFWQTWWFVLSLVFFVFILVLLIFRKILRFKVQKANSEHAIKLALAEAEQKALRAQMNPHFIFNSLNSIQNIIVQENYDKAYVYLGKFSKMVRAILENSRLTDVSIQKEIDLLKWYLDIEQLRFKDKFQFEVNVDETISLSKKIPSLVVQPLVENAIIHGLFPKKSTQLLKLNVEVVMFNAELIKITVEDNGVGRSEEVNESKQSYGLKLIKERLNYFDPSGQSGIDIIDLKDAKNNSLGTRVQLIIKTKK